jgi:hypothetical protein
MGFKGATGTDGSREVGWLVSGRGRMAGKSIKLGKVGSQLLALIFLIYFLHDGLQHPKDARIRLGIFWLLASSVFWLMSQYPPTAKRVYAMQMESYRKAYSEEESRQNGLFPTIATAVLGVTFILAGIL